MIDVIIPPSQLLTHFLPHLHDDKALNIGTNALDIQAGCIYYLKKNTSCEAFTAKYDPNVAYINCDQCVDYI